MTTSRALSFVFLSSVLILTSCKSDTTIQSDEDATRLSETKSMKFADLMDLGEDYQCTFSHGDETGIMNSGTIYLEANGENMRGDFMQTQVDGKVVESHMIRKGMTSYMWSAQMEQGITMKVEDKSELFGTSAKETMGMSDTDTALFDCDDWSPDSSMFTPPSDITFMDMSVQMKQMQKQMEGMKGTQCAACDQMPDGAAKTQCKAALGC